MDGWNEAAGREGGVRVIYGRAWWWRGGIGVGIRIGIGIGSQEGINSSLRFGRRRARTYVRASGAPHPHEIARTRTQRHRHVHVHHVEYPWLHGPCKQTRAAVALYMPQECKLQRQEQVRPGAPGHVGEGREEQRLRHHRAPLALCHRAGWEKSDILPLSKRVSLKCHFAD